MGRGVLNHKKHNIWGQFLLWGDIGGVNNSYCGEWEAQKQHLCFTNCSNIPEFTHFTKIWVALIKQKSNGEIAD